MTDWITPATAGYILESVSHRDEFKEFAEDSEGVPYGYLTKMRPQLFRDAVNTFIVKDILFTLNRLYNQAYSEYEEAGKVRKLEYLTQFMKAHGNYDSEAWSMLHAFGDEAYDRTMVEGDSRGNYSAQLNVLAEELNDELLPGLEPDTLEALTYVLFKHPFVALIREHELDMQLNLTTNLLLLIARADTVKPENLEAWVHIVDTWSAFKNNEDFDFTPYVN
jgi:hypothetical protein